MNTLTLFRKLTINSVLVLSLLVISACSSSEDKANKFYENGMQLFEKGELVKANVEFRNALQLNRKMTKAIWGQVLIAEKQGRPRKQFEALSAVLVNEPEHLQAIVKLGRLLLVAGQLDKALEKSDRSMEINKQDLSVLSLRAAILFKLEDTQGAIKLAKEVLTIDPHYIDALITLAVEKLTAGDTQEAIEYLEQGLKRDNKNIVLNLIKIKALEDSAEIELAEETLIGLVDAYPKVANFNAMLAQFYIKHKKKDKAEKIYRMIIKNNPQDFKAKINLVQFLNDIDNSDTGLKQLQIFSQQNPHNDELKFALVQLYLMRKEIALAYELLTKIINEKPGSDIAIKAKGIMAVSLLSNGDEVAAEKIINEILTIDKQNQDALILKASIDIKRQKYDEAIGDLRLVLRDTPDSSRASFFLADAYNLSGSPELADEQYFKAFKSSNFNTNYGMFYARFLLKRKQPRRAEKVIQDVLSISRTSLPALQLLAQIRLSLGDWVGAQEVADVVKRIGDKSNIAYQINNAVLVGKKDYSESIELLKKTYLSTPDKVQPVVSLVRTYLLAGKTEDAARFLDAVIKTNPKNTTARILRGRVYFSNGKIKQAINTCQEAINNDPENTSSYYHLAVILLHEKKYDRARDILNKGLSVAPNNFPLGITLAQLYEVTGQFENAIKAYEVLNQSRPNSDIVANNLASLLTEYRTDKKSLNKAFLLSQRFQYSDVPQFMDTFGWANYHLGKYDDASSLLKSAIKQLPGIPDFHYHLGMSYLAKENKSRAREELEKALELAGEKPFKKSEEIRTTLEKL